MSRSDPTPALGGLRLLQQREILIAGDSGGAQVVQDDEDRNRSVARDDDGTADAGFRVDSMVALLSHQLKARQLNDATETLVRKGGNARHRARTGLEGQLHMFSGNERRVAPIRARWITRDEALFTEDVLQGAHPLTLFQEEANGFAQHSAGVLNSVPATGHPKLRAGADERVPFFEDERRELNLMHSTCKYSVAEQVESND